ncbi:MAG: hypothetical protein NTW21_33550 [Verrucomicrobia bacterium]|nr:hypothetical protein [Verrucomicrobiota bacterium]
MTRVLTSAGILAAALAAAGNRWSAAVETIVVVPGILNPIFT